MYIGTFVDIDNCDRFTILFINFSILIFFFNRQNLLKLPPFQGENESKEKSTNGTVQQQGQGNTLPNDKSRKEKLFNANTPKF
jgi:hypothetical protein